ncbi:spindle/kinetochore-associated-like protein [Wolffia australiana]
MDSKDAGASLDLLISSFNSRIVELQELVIARNMYPATSIQDLSAVDTALQTIESQTLAIMDRLREEREAIPKAKKLIEQSQRQQKKIQQILAHLPARVSENVNVVEQTPSRILEADAGCNFYNAPEQSSTVAKEKKGRQPAPRWYISSHELDSLSSYMRGRLTLEKVNIAINEMAAYAEAAASLVGYPKKKLSEDVWEKAHEMRDISQSESVKGKYFFVETDMKGPGLKLDNTGKAILTVFRHLGRIQEARIGHHRVIILLKPPTVV